ncbi:hypothetical protein JCM19239_7102 [Vibrio variabilis]|uniref:Uncharacterized protein n=1 Tax=Vibrio variabilis TaxID=990271 RepID=A0ABQ0JM10_9VIBR|nr:hypothetical protein JCM19239_7102 [Vibrio variabilis]
MASVDCKEEVEKRIEYDSTKYRQNNHGISENCFEFKFNVF